MRKAIAIAALAASVCLLGGCDFFRQLAGRPTSKEIEAKRVRIEQLLTENQRILDSLDALRAALGDTPAVPDAVTDAVVDTPQASQTQSQTQTQTQTQADKQTVVQQDEPKVQDGSLPYKYYIITGSFSSRENAEKQAAKTGKNGYPGTLIPYKNGMTIVGICPSNSLSTIQSSLEQVQGTSFCPRDAWIYTSK